MLLISIFFVGTQGLFACWMDKVESLSSAARNKLTFSITEETYEEVLNELEKWNPEKKTIFGKLSSWGWEKALRIRDTYLNNDSARGIVRGYFLSNFILTAGAYLTPYSSGIDPEEMYQVLHGGEAGLEILRNIHKVPYLHLGEADELAESAAITLHHVSTAYGYHKLSNLLGLGALWRVCHKSNYINVVLRHLNRLYKKKGQSKRNHKLLVQQIIIIHNSKEHQEN